MPSFLPPPPPKYSYDYSLLVTISEKKSKPDQASAHTVTFLKIVAQMHQIASQALRIFI